MIKYGVADYGLMAWYGNHYDYDDKIAMVRELGFDGLERVYPKSAEDALKKVSNLRKWGMDFATCNCNDIEEAIRWTSALGGKYVWDNVLGHNFEDYLRQLQYMAKACKNYGIDVVVHNHMGFHAESQEAVERVLNECPDVKLLFDVGHMYLAGGDVRYIVDNYFDRIAAYHFKGYKIIDLNHKDWDKRGYFCGLMQGDDVVDNEYVFKTAVKRGFDGWVFVEQDTHKRDPKLDLKENLETLKKWRSEV